MENAPAAELRKSVPARLDFWLLRPTCLRLLRGREEARAPGL